MTVKSSQLFSSLQACSSYLDFNHFSRYITNHNEKLLNNVQRSQSRKLFNLGFRNVTETLDPKKLVLNYSNKVLTNEEIEVLSHGLKFGMPPKKINYSKFFLSFEKLINDLKENQIYEKATDSWQRLRTSLKNLAFSSYYSFRPPKVNNNENFDKIIK